MTDSQMIALFWDRNEDAIRETDRAYGRKLFVLSDKILHSHQDAEESVSDTYMKTWETIPPHRPVYFFAYLAKLCRNFSLARIQWQSKIVTETPLSWNKSGRITAVAMSWSSLSTTTRRPIPSQSI